MASTENKDHPRREAPNRGPCGTRALTTQPAVGTQEPDGGIGESNLVTSLVGLCKSKVPDAETVWARQGEFAG